MSSAGDAKKTKESKARLRACMDNELTHLRVGWWNGEPVDRITFIGMASDLHGTACTCCPPRGDAA